MMNCLKINFYIKKKKNLKIIIKKLDSKFFNIFSLINYTFIDLTLFFNFYLNFKKTKVYLKDTFPYSDELKTLKSEGVIKIKKVYNSSTIKELEKEFDYLKDNFKNLSRAKIEAKINKKFLDEQFFSKGEKYYKRFLKNIQINDPFIKAPQLLKIALNQTFIDIAKNYFSTDHIYITGVNFRRSYFNHLPASDTQMYHRDRNSYKILKVFIYLNNVDEDIGPFQYVLKSHKKWPLLSNRKYRWDDDYIKKIYGSKSIFSATSSVGDVIIADTTGFHKGKNLNKRYRTMLTLNYSTFAEKKSKKVKIKKFESYPFKISDEQKNILKYSSVEA